MGAGGGGGVRAARALLQPVAPCGTGRVEAAPGASQGVEGGRGARGRVTHAEGRALTPFLRHIADSFGQTVRTAVPVVDSYRQHIRSHCSSGRAGRRTVVDKRVFRRASQERAHEEELIHAHPGRDHLSHPPSRWSYAREGGGGGEAPRGEPRTRLRRALCKTVRPAPEERPRRAAPPSASCAPRGARVCGRVAAAMRDAHALPYCTRNSHPHCTAVQRVRARARARGGIRRASIFR